MHQPSISLYLPWGKWWLNQLRVKSKDTIDGFIKTMHIIAKEARDTPDFVKEALIIIPLAVDDVLAAKHPILTYRQLINDMSEEA